ncbi:MAG: hypothetical protein GWO20_11190 [Candidatus Korarchaeota archaeon]|nr:hypothetical protein [Candidatus Korarchaeota archaeon]NIU82744.1 hypothetical protein [Candidatus Thorarchaeota archaeon]NIW14166.1 hypothetical protein [Candidatus Thorarchaeota archaeon]NIW52269.1 hypothetical protein [Candidatus Korarchaeota archaeon]
MNEKEQEERDVRKHVVSLLKRGNRLLAEHCPKCGTPLLLIKDKGLKYCPKCQVYLATREEIEKGKVAREEDIYEFDQYWEEQEVNEGTSVTERRETPQKERQPMKREVTAEPLKRVEETQEAPSDVLVDDVTGVIHALLRKFHATIENREVPPEQLLQWLRTLVKIKNALDGEHVE